MRLFVSGIRWVCRELSIRFVEKGEWMNNISCLKVVTLVSVTMLGTTTVLSDTTAKASELMPSMYKAPNPLAQPDLSQYIEVQDNQYILHLPENITASTDEIHDLQHKITEMNLIIRTHQLTITEYDATSKGSHRVKRGRPWKYWGNGIYTKGNQVRVDWNTAWKSVGQISVNSWVDGAHTAFGQQPSRGLVRPDMRF